MGQQTKTSTKPRCRDDKVLRLKQCLLVVCVITGGLFGTLSSPLAASTRLAATAVVSLTACSQDGDVTEDGTVTTADAQLALQLLLEPALANGCALEQANVLNPLSSRLTPADILCIFRHFLSQPSCLDPPQIVSGGNQFTTPNRATGVVGPITLDGRLSVAPNGNALTYGWTFDRVPGASALTDADLSALDSPMTVFTPDTLGQYALVLTVVDERGNTVSQRVSVNVQAPDGNQLEDCACEALPGEIVELSILVTAVNGEPVPNWPVLFTREGDEGQFVVGAQMSTSFSLSANRPPLQESPPSLCIEAGRDAQGLIRRVICFTDNNGVATALFRLGDEAVFVSAQGRGVSPPVRIRVGDDRDSDCFPNDLDSDPDNADANNNGVRDGDEDLDEDGLTNCQELFFDTVMPPFDFRDPDSDDDGIPDGDEDLDHDGLLGADERQQGTDRFNADTDDDGFIDSEEVEFGSDPLDTESDPRDNLQPIQQASSAGVGLLNSVVTVESFRQASVAPVGLLNTTDPTGPPVAEAASATVSVENVTAP